MSETSNSKNPVRFIAVVGPTASGKSAVALEIARSCGGEIVCCDSVQLYRGFDIGSAKPSASERQQVPHHLFDVFAAHEPCDAAIYAQKARACMDEIIERGRWPLVTGGTGLYLRALTGENWDVDLPRDEGLRQELFQRSSEDLFRELERLDPVRAKQLHPNDRFRVVRALEILKLTGKPVPQPRTATATVRDHILIVMNPSKDRLHESIRQRTAEMLRLGLVDEVKGLLAQGISVDVKPMSSIGYAEVRAFLRGDLAESHLQETIETSTKQYAKRQNTWFKKLPRDYTLTDPEELSNILPQLLERLT